MATALQRVPKPMNRQPFHWGRRGRCEKTIKNGWKCRLLIWHPRNHRLIWWQFTSFWDRLFDVSGDGITIRNGLQSAGWWPLPESGHHCLQIHFAHFGVVNLESNVSIDDVNTSVSVKADINIYAWVIHICIDTYVPVLHSKHSKLLLTIPSSCGQATLRLLKESGINLPARSRDAGTLACTSFWYTRLRFALFAWSQ